MCEALSQVNYHPQIFGPLSELQPGPAVLFVTAVAAASLFLETWQTVLGLLSSQLTAVHLSFPLHSKGCIQLQREMFP